MSDRFYVNPELQPEYGTLPATISSMRAGDSAHYEDTYRGGRAVIMIPPGW